MFPSSTCVIVSACFINIYHYFTQKTSFLFRVLFCRLHYTPLSDNKMQATCNCRNVHCINAKFF